MKWIVLEPKKQPRIEEVKGNTYENLRKFIGGYIDRAALTESIDMWVDDEGLLKQLPLNFWRDRETPLVGVIVIAAHDGYGNTVGLTDEQIAWVMEYFQPTIDDTCRAYECEHIPYKACYTFVYYEDKDMMHVYDTSRDVEGKKRLIQRFDGTKKAKGIWMGNLKNWSNPLRMIAEGKVFLGWVDPKTIEPLDDQDPDFNPWKGIDL